MKKKRWSQEIPQSNPTPKITAKINRTAIKKNKNLDILADMLAMPLNPNIPATTAIIRKIIAHLSIINTSYILYNLTLIYIS